MSEIHPTAIVDPGAKLGAGIKIGPYSVVDGDVTLGDGVIIESHAVVTGLTTIGDGVHIFPFASVGNQPQDLKYGGEKSTLEIGPRTRIREHVTIHTGTEGGGMITRIGADCLIMVAAHVAHDCLIGNNVILVNNVTLGGHVEIGDHAIVGGQSAVHQFVRIGHHAMIGGASGVEADVIPYGMVFGGRAYLQGLNLVGLKRHGFEREEIHSLRAAYRELFADEGLFLDRLENVGENHAGRELVGQVVDFIKADTSRALCQPA